jgi:uncharacterized protein YqeY
MLIQKLREDKIQAMKDGFALEKNLLSTLIGDCCKNIKEPDDALVISVIKKFIKNARETSEHIKDYGQILKTQQFLDCLDEIDILESYLPKQLDEQAIKTIMANIIVGAPEGFALKDVMAFFKKNFEGQYDGAMVSRMAKEIF